MECEPGLEGSKAMGEATQTNTDSPLWIKGVRGLKWL